MKFTCSVDIKLPRTKVVALWENEDNLKEWQDGFLGFEHISGAPGEVGSKLLMKYKNGKREMELEETILVNDLPEMFTGQYVHTHMTNTMENVFTELDASNTRWTANLDYSILNGFMIRLIAKIFPGLFKKQTQKWLDQFKEFAERSN